MLRAGRDAKAARLAGLGIHGESLPAAMHLDLDPGCPWQGAKLVTGQLAQLEDVMRADSGTVTGAFAFVRRNHRRDLSGFLRAVCAGFHRRAGGRARELGQGARVRL